MPDLTALRSLVAVIDQGSVVAAARVIGYSPAGVSRHLTALERDLGMSLFKRTARSITPSVAARVLADKARLLLEEADQWDRDARALAQGEEGVLRLAYFRAAGTTVIPRALAILAKRQAGIRVVLNEQSLSEDVVELLRKGEADLGFVWGYPDFDDPSSNSRPLFSEALVLLTADDRDDLHEDPTNLAQLSSENFAMAVGHVGSPPLVDAMFLAAGLPTPTVIHRPPDHAMQRSLISAGIVISLTPALGVADDFPGVRASVVKFDFRRTYLAQPAGVVNPLTAIVSDAIRQASSEFKGFGLKYIG
jgi:DNA-binding transcriptional LysR family regulator